MGDAVPSKIWPRSPEHPAQVEERTILRHNYCETYGAVALRPLAEDDIEYVRILRNRYRDCFLFSGEISAPAQKKWYSAYLEKDADYMFTVYLGERRIGAAAIYEVDRDAGTGEFGRLMIERQDPPIKGLGADAVRAACRVAFEQMGLHRLKLYVYCDNVPAQITYLKAGFRPTDVFAEDSGRKILRMESVGV